MSKSISDELREYVQSAYLHGLPVENLDTGEIEPPADISDVEWIVEAILSHIEENYVHKDEFYSKKEIEEAIGKDEYIYNKINRRKMVDNYPREIRNELRAEIRKALL